MTKYLTVIGITSTFIGILTLGALLMGLPIMLLWNWLMPAIFDLGLITFFQAVGISLLSGLLFSSNNSRKDN